MVENFSACVFHIRILAANAFYITSHQFNSIHRRIWKCIFFAYQKQFIVSTRYEFPRNFCLNLCCCCFFRSKFSGTTVVNERAGSIAAQTLMISFVAFHSGLRWLDFRSISEEKKSYSAIIWINMNISGGQTMGAYVERKSKHAWI